MPEDEPVIVIGAGIAGLTAAALLAHEGLPVTLLEAHHQVGGCAGTFKRGEYVFDVGATQVAGFEVGGIHERLFRHLEWPLPKAMILDPGCLIDLADGLPPIHLWNNPEKWKKERQKHFPGSESFWTLCNFLHKSNWSIASRDPILPIRNIWDLRKLISSVRLENLPSTFFTPFSIFDILRICGCHEDQRLRKFLDMQLKLYSQKNSEFTAALYGATVLQMAQSPIGLWHLDGSMQTLSDNLKASFLRDGGKLLLRNRVVNLKTNNEKNNWFVEVIDQRGKFRKYCALDIVFTLPPQSLLELMTIDSGLPINFQIRLKKLPKPSGAVVLYAAIDRNLIPNNYPSHLQLASKNFVSIFISISQNGDGRAPKGQATLIASVFVDIDNWFNLSKESYQFKKQKLLLKIVEELSNYFKFDPKDLLHQELATPMSFMKWTGRPKGIVGGLGQNPLMFGPFGLPSRTPMKGLWLCGDSIYPGEGTAGVSQSSLMACRQLIANRGLKEIVID